MATLDINALHAECRDNGGRQLFVMRMAEVMTATAKLREKNVAGPYRIARTGDTWRLEYMLGRKRVVQSSGDVGRVYDVARRTKLCSLFRLADELWASWSGWEAWHAERSARSTTAA